MKGMELNEVSLESNVSSGGKNHLLVIAINDYIHCSKLNNAVRDVDAFIKLMTTRYHFDLAHVISLKDSQATKKNIERAFDRLIDQVEKNDNLVVYFSGHGRFHKSRGGFWIPVEAGPTDKDWVDYISNDLIKTYLARIKSFHTFLIADSCFSGAFFAEIGKEKNLINRVDTEPSRWALTSGKKEVVSDGKAGANSPFATALLSVLEKAAAPPSVMQICTLVMEKVAANEFQTPMGSALAVPGHQGGQMVLHFRNKEENVVKQETKKAKPVSEDNSPTEPINTLRFKIRSLLKYFVGRRKYWAYLVTMFLIVLYILKLNTPIISPQIVPTSDLILLDGGKYPMGDVMKDHSQKDESIHDVSVKSFWIAKHELSIEEFDAFCKDTNRELPSDNGWGRGKRPVINVDWYDAVKYCNWRSLKERLKPCYIIDTMTKDPNNYNASDAKRWLVKLDISANGYRLPTEEEWEYAARAKGQEVRFGNGENTANPKKINFYTSSGAGTINASLQRTAPIGSFPHSSVGLHDMSGNVSEWCWNWYGDYSNQSVGTNTASNRIIRGGAYYSEVEEIRCAFRFQGNPNTHDRGIGFRLARNF